ncbi:MAG: hypothetical protein IJX12_03985 [Lachnospiraceae bacterium]|nr:hypothetical protein [Lachnospiraceae bacterium]
MSEKEKELVEENTEAETEEVEAMDDYDDAEELGYQRHEFSLFDSAAEIILVIFLVAYVGFKIVSFFIDYPNGTDLDVAVAYLFDVIVGALPAVCLIAILELHEKLDKIAYNLELNSEYMARYQQDLLTVLKDKKQD